VIQEFHISITAVGVERYLLRTEAVAPGVPLAEAQVDLPIEAWLAQSAALAQDPLQALLTMPGSQAAFPGSPYGRQGSDAPWMQLGQSLYQHIFRDRIRDSWLAAQGIALNRRQTLRLRLGIKESRLQRLPWEVLYGDDRPLATGNDVTLCRYYQAPNAVDLGAMAPLPVAHEPVRVLVVISAPDDQERLALRHEIQQIIGELERSTPQTAKPALGSTVGTGFSPIQLQLTILEQPGRPELVQALEQGQFQVLHYAGHSDVSETGGDLFLVNRQTGLTDWLSGEDLAGLLVNNGIRLAIFNSCRGAFTPQDDASAGWREQNLVQALVNRGVPAVIAMAERIPDDVAIGFTQLIYRNLHQGYPIDLCLSRVRQGLISAYRSDHPYWMLPILYLRPEFDGYLYRQGEADTELDDFLREDVPVSDGTLIPPDYSTDPDISNLAQEMFAGHEAKARYTSAHGQSTHVGDWVDDLESERDADLDAETVAMQSLVQQLSTPGDGATQSSDPSFKAPPNEDLSPQWPQTHPAVLEQPSPLPSNGHQGSAPGSSSELANADTTAQTGTSQQLTPETNRWADDTAPDAGQKPFVVPTNLIIWISLGLIGLGASLILAIIMLSRAANVEQPSVSTPVTPELDAGNVSPNDSPALMNAVAALTVNNTGTARFFIEQLLDLGDYDAAQAAISAASPNQLLDPNIAFIRGRLIWQELARGSGTGSVYDAMRYWGQAVEANEDSLESWVALGFAYYDLNEYDQAVNAWEKAIALDRQNFRDGEPSNQQQVSDDFVINAYAGLAMAYQELSKLELSAGERSRLQSQAQEYFQLVLRLAPEMLNPEQLALQWLWTTSLISDWQEATARLAVEGVIENIPTP
jgi:tetratricopeptide (TPR) repeat protein